MPLFDHHRPPLARDIPWSGFHSKWANALSDDLNVRLLPPGFRAIPLVKLRGGAVEIDVATVREGEASADWTPAVGDWTPAAASGTAVVDFVGIDTFEVRILHGSNDVYNLVATIELVSPSNKEGPADRRALAAKCASYLQHRAAVLTIDAVTVYRANMHADILDVLAVNGTTPWRSTTNLAAVSYRPFRENSHTRIEWWTEALELGQPLPTLPLWVGTDIRLPLDLEATYMRAFELLRMPGGPTP